MHVSATEHRRAQIGPFTVDLLLRELWNDGRKVDLQEKPFQVLAVLIERPGELVTRDELRSRLWPADTFVDFEHGINTAIKKLREALSDDPERPRYVETLPRRGYRFIERVSEIQGAATRPRLLVLPFEDLNAVDDEYFADGLTERVIVQLGRTCKRIDVIAPLSVMHSKKIAGASRVLEESHPDYLLAGTVQHANGQVRFTARLVRGRDQCCVWSDSYIREAREIFFVQDDISTHVARALLALLSPSDSDIATSRWTTMPAVSAKYLVARHFNSTCSVPGFLEAKEYAVQVIAEDPSFAPAYALLALLCATLAAWGAVPIDAAYQEVESWAGMALALSENLEEAYCALGWKALDWDADFAAAEQYLSRATAINPSYPLPYILASQLAAGQGRLREAIAKITRAVDLDPVSPQATTTAACMYYLAGQWEPARECFAKTIHLYPRLAIAHVSLSWLYLTLGDLASALSCCRTSVDCDPGNPVCRATLAQILAVAGRQTEAVAILEDLLALRQSSHVPPYWIAQVYVGLGDVSKAVAWIETAFRERCSWRLMAGIDPKLRPLANDPRFVRLLAEAHLPVTGSMAQPLSARRDHGRG